MVALTNSVGPIGLGPDVDGPLMPRKSPFRKLALPQLFSVFGRLALHVLVLLFRFDGVERRQGRLDLAGVNNRLRAIEVSSRFVGLWYAAVADRL